MKVDLFDFDLPPDRIAQSPIQPRDRARLLHVTADALSDRSVADLPGLLRPGDLVVVNDTKVIPARLTARRGDARIELTLHKRVGPAVWNAFARPARRCRPGDVLRVAESFTAEVTAKGEGGEITVAFDRGGEDLLAALGVHGRMPLPPYIKRDEAPDDADRADYQNPFGAKEGAVAAPTASLHFTPDLLGRLADRDIRQARLTLHVGAGTFLPVKSDDTDAHRMHSEWFELPPATAEAIERTRAAGGRVVAVGTTVLRTLEAAARPDGSLQTGMGETDIFIVPGHRFRVVDLLLTNFHLPRSTLFMLVSAFMGLERMRAAYAHAIAGGYRFYSYGDACLLERTCSNEY
ncbi:tRNA preQ1(34) S-adenosylmethionine ribosyltransferase-isomerase QueA [Marinivivus vitaminiproducens]|uniref:tRNA preQ1(34) S-adenosylmethionine ribosyltransferase-isomerase QueA n=1 Tax=Marinivivus vitaminiproducens TaxID=3035935 RepID=UPI002798D7B7|nr:tRNA preQ1(34) S-adenosylmethionine ribosyltransferase-isomerase QueA [Geminicoccaceae bacterium SCSIO 64248]